MNHSRSLVLGDLVRAKARASRRAKDAGAVMFIVAMTLAVIATMGVYALNVASTEVKTAGFVREQTQVHYLNEYGVMAAAQDVSWKGALYYVTLMNSPTTRDTNCPSLYGMLATSGTLPLACRVSPSAELTTSWIPTVTPLVPYTSNANEYTRGSVGLPTTPEFYVEFTDMNWKPVVSGYATNNSPKQCSVEFTATSMGSCRPCPRD